MVVGTASTGPTPYGPLLLLFLVLVGASIPSYLSYQPLLENFEEQLRIGLILLPLGLLLALKWLSSERRGVRLPKAEPVSIHRAGGSPWGIGVLLVVILMMIWYQSSLQESWNPVVRV